MSDPLGAEASRACDAEAGVDRCVFEWERPTTSTLRPAPSRSASVAKALVKSCVIAPIGFGNLVTVFLLQVVQAHASREGIASGQPCFRMLPLAPGTLSTECSRVVSTAVMAGGTAETLAFCLRANHLGR